MFMKHFAPNRCEPSIEVIMKMGVQWGVRIFFGGVRLDVNVNEGLKLLRFFFLKIGGGGGGGRSGWM